MIFATVIISLNSLSFSFINIYSHSCTPNCNCIPVRRLFCGVVCACILVMWNMSVQHVFGLNTYDSQPRNRRLKLSTLPSKPLPRLHHEPRDLTSKPSS